MKTAEEWQDKRQIVLNHGDINAKIELIKQIKLDAYRAGGLAAAAFAGFGSANVRAGNRDNILTHFNNPKLEIPE